MMDKDKKEEKEEKIDSPEPKVKFEMPKVGKKATEEKKEPLPETPSVETPEKPSEVPTKKPSAEIPTRIETPIKPSVETSKAAPEDGGVSQQTPESPQVTTWMPEGEETGSSKRILLIILIIVAVVALIGGGVFVYLKTKPGKEEKVEPTPVVTPLPSPIEVEEPTPTPSPETELKKEDLEVQVLNGSGVPGAAGKAKAFLEGLGYQEVKAGNADSYDYEETEVSIKETKKDYLGLLLKDLETEYTLATETGTLAEDSDLDAVVIIGKE